MPLIPSEVRFLLDASGILASSLDWQVAIRRLVELAVPALAEWCCIDIIDIGDGPARFCGGAHGPDLQPLLRELERDFPLDPASDLPPARAIATDDVVLLEDLDADFVADLELPSRQVEIVSELGVRAVLAVPMAARGRVLGAMTLVSASSPRFSRGTVALARELGQRAGLSIDNALLYRHAQAASRAKSDFLAVMSHELRTPLNSVLGYVDLIQAGIGGPVTDHQQSYLAKIRVSARHLLQIIDEILTYSRMDAGRERVRAEHVSLASVLADVVAVAEPIAREQGLRFTVDEIPDETVFTDAHKVRQILLNLLTNAVKFTASGWIRLSARLDAVSCAFIVADSGRGIDARDVERIFEPFWQVEDAPTRSRGGTGLGLAVSRRLCRLLGGDLTVVSEPGRGATFTATVARTYTKAVADLAPHLTRDPLARSDRSGISSSLQPRSES